MAYFVLAYPRLSPADHTWIEAYRAAHEPRFDRLPPAHFTLVFGVDDMAEDKFVEEIERRLAGASKIAFELTAATVNHDHTGERFNLFLVPKQGHAEIIELHDALYAGALARHLRRDIDYIPHITIGGGEGPDCQRQADALNASGVALRGTLDAVDIVRYEAGKITPLGTFALG